jgi:hypothetical protein
VTGLGERAQLGALIADLPTGPVARLDHGNIAIVEFLSGTLASVTDVALFGGANAWRSRAPPGVWEVLQAAQAELLAPGRYRLTRLLRGQRGTEWAMGDPTPAGARVVVLDAALSTLPIDEAELGLPATWRIGPALRPPSDESYVATELHARGHRPAAVLGRVHVEQPWRTARVPGDLVIRWTRRSRALAADSWTAAEVPLGEEREAYEVEILDGAAVRRTLSTVTTSVTYTAAEQIADFGALLAPGRYARRQHRPALGPRRAGGGEDRHAHVLEAGLPMIGGPAGRLRQPLSCGNAELSVPVPVPAPARPRAACARARVRARPRPVIPKLRARGAIKSFGAQGFLASPGPASRRFAPKEAPALARQRRCVNLGRPSGS